MMMMACVTFFLLYFIPFVVWFGLVWLRVGGGCGCGWVTYKCKFEGGIGTRMKWWWWSLSLSLLLSRMWSRV